MNSQLNSPPSVLSHSKKILLFDTFVVHLSTNLQGRLAPLCPKSTSASPHRAALHRSTPIRPVTLALHRPTPLRTVPYRHVCPATHRTPRPFTPRFVRPTALRTAPICTASSRPGSLSTACHAAMRSSPRPAPPALLRAGRPASLRPDPPRTLAIPPSPFETCSRCSHRPAPPHSLHSNPRCPSLSPHRRPRPPTGGAQVLTTAT